MTSRETFLSVWSCSAVYRSPRASCWPGLLSGSTEGRRAVTGPKPKHSTVNKRVARAVVGIGKTTRAALRNEISDTRRAHVYLSDAVYTGEAGDPKRPRIPDNIMPDVEADWRAGSTWLKLGEKYGFSAGGLRLAYQRWKKETSERENESGT